jgi:uncharacterized protein with PIN domain
VGQVIDLVYALLYLPLDLLYRVLDEPAATAAALVVVALAVVATRRYQRCPHCHRLVRRARGEWLRCSRCGRQYHRGLHPVK